MAGSLLQSSSVGFEAVRITYGQIKEDKWKGRRVDRPMLWRVPAKTTPTPTPSLMIRNFSGLLRTSTTTGMVPIVKLGQSLLLHSSDFPPIIFNPSTISSGRRRRERCLMVPKAVDKFGYFSEKAKRVLALALEEAKMSGYSCIGTEDILVGIIGEGSGIGYMVLKSMSINLKNTRAEIAKMRGKGTKFGSCSDSKELSLTSNAKKIFEHLLEEVQGQGLIETEHLLLRMIRNASSNAVSVLRNLGANPTDIHKQVMIMLDVSDLTHQVLTDDSGNRTRTRTPALNKYGTNLTQLAKEGKLHPVVGRKEQIEQVTQILGCCNQNNPILIGEAGVGKTAIAEGLAQLIAKGDVNKKFKGKKVIALNLVELVAGAKYRGDFEGKLHKVIEEVKANKEIILFIDEVHTLIGAGAAEGAMDAANILKPALARGELQCIGATTQNEYRKYIEKDPALKRRFQPVNVPEASVDETIQILKGLRVVYDKFHGVRYTDEALIAAAQLSYQYMSDQFLPDKAVRLMDEAGSYATLCHSQIEETSGDGGSVVVVTKADVQHVVSSRTSIPISSVSTPESDCLLNMEEMLHGQVIGQDEGVKVISCAIRRSRVGLKNPNRPIASFIFAGPTGVGKSELAKVLASSYFGSERAMIRMDMSEFMEKHTVSKLIGSPPGYIGHVEGGQLTEAVRRRPYTVVLFDEIEKAHPDICNLMLQILDDGRLTDSMGRTVDFKNTLIIMTSNIGSRVIEKGRNRSFGFDLFNEDIDKEKDNSSTRIKSLVIEELKQHFKPEFLNRLDEIIVFKQLTKGEVKKIAEIMLKEVFGWLKKKDIKVEATERFKERVVEEGYDPSYGARPLRRAITRLLEDRMAEKMLDGEISEGDSVTVDVDFHGNVTFQKHHEAAKLLAAVTV